MHDSTRHKSKQNLLILVSCIILGACGGGGGTPTDNSAQGELQSNASSNDENRKAVYQKILDDLRFPTDFYKEPENTSNLFYTIKHISNHDMSIYDVNFSYPLCEENFSVALQKADNEALNSDTTLIDNNDNQWYYEFSRVQNSNSSSIYKQRIYKCNAYAVNASNDYKGQYNISTISPNDYLDFIEYQWYFSFNNNYGNAILSHSITNETTDAIRATITNASISQFGDCDQITITEHHYDLDKATRKITRYEIIIDVFGANKENNTINICS